MQRILNFFSKPQPQKELAQREANNTEIRDIAIDTAEYPAIRSSSVSMTAVKNTYNDRLEGQLEAIVIDNKNYEAAVPAVAPGVQVKPIPVEEKKYSQKPVLAKASIAVDDNPDRAAQLDSEYKNISCFAKMGSMSLMVAGGAFQLASQANIRAAMESDGYMVGYEEKKLGAPYSGGSANALDWDVQCTAIATLLGASAALEWKNNGFAVFTQYGAFKLAKSKGVSDVLEGVGYLAVGVGTPVAMVSYSLYRLTHSYAASMFSKGYNDGYYGKSENVENTSLDLKLLAAGAFALVPSVAALGYGLFKGIKERVRPNRQVTVELTEVRTDAPQMRA